MTNRTHQAFIKELEKSLPQRECSACYRWWRGMTLDQRRLLVEEHETGHVLELWIATLERLRSREHSRG